MFIKICGITKPKEIEFINELHPDYIGFVFAKSKRKVTGKEASTLAKTLDKSIKTVGVFRNNSIEEIEEVLKFIDLDVVQLHGSEDEELIKELKSKGNFKVWKAISIGEDFDSSKSLDYSVDAFLLDGSAPGSGKRFKWDLVDKSKFNKKFILAGGINEDNVEEGIKLFNPDGVDVSSGVEVVTENGFIKDYEKMKRIIRKVRENNEGKI